MARWSPGKAPSPNRTAHQGCAPRRGIGHCRSALPRTPSPQRGERHPRPASRPGGFPGSSGGGCEPWQCDTSRIASMCERRPPWRGFPRQQEAGACTTERISLHRAGGGRPAGGTAAIPSTPIDAIAPLMQHGHAALHRSLQGASTVHCNGASEGLQGTFPNALRGMGRQAMAHHPSPLHRAGTVEQRKAGALDGRHSQGQGTRFLLRDAKRLIQVRRNHAAGRSVVKINPPGTQLPRLAHRQARMTASDRIRKST